MAKHERDVAKERFWREALAGQASSGLKARAFCRREELAESAFYLILDRKRRDSHTIR